MGKFQPTGFSMGFASLNLSIKKFDLTQKETSQPFQNKDSMSECEHCEGVFKSIIDPTSSHVFQEQI